MGDVKCLVRLMRRYLLTSVVVLLFMLAAFSQALALSQPFMVKDINTSGAYTNSISSSLVTVGSVTFFAANDDDHGQELWKTDGTEAGTVMVKDIWPGSSGSAPYGLTNVNGTLFFVANDGINGSELWKSDGTAEGTVMVKDIASGSMPSNPAYLTNINGTLFFTAYDGVNGGELWKSDGTAEGTVLVKDIAPGAGNSDPQNLTNVNGTVFFRAANPTYGMDLWKSDGTAAGTTLLKSENSYNLQELVNVNGTLFFIVSTAIWKSDGTAGGTMKVADTGSVPMSLTNVNGTLFFATNWPTVYLWKSDGTASGTVQVKELAFSNIPAPAYLTNVNGTLFFNFMNELWKSDGTSDGTVLVKDQYFNPCDLTNVNGALFFTADDAVVGRELWKSDGTADGTIMVKNIYPGKGSSYPAGFANANGTLLFSASDPINGGELWKSDGTPEGTVMVKNIFTGTGSSLPSWLTDVNGMLFFGADDGFHGNELWKSDGTAAGTTLLKDIYSGEGYSGENSSRPDNFLSVNGTLFFTAEESVNGRELWKSDGTADGTELVKDIFPGALGSYPSNLTRVGDTLYFAASGQDGFELWKSDGTADGTVQVKDIYPGGDSNPRSLVNVNGTLFFTADDGVNGTELWKSDGTVDGTVQVKDVNPGAGYSNPGYLTNVNGMLFFTADDGVNGNELWKSDGTAAGTGLVKDINQGAGYSNPNFLTDVNGTLFFTADDGVNGNELWKSDGTAAGTVMVKDIVSGDSSYPFNLINVNGVLFFVANDQTHGGELWKSDGTAAGTVMVKDINTGSGSSNPTGFVVVGNKLYFFADDGVHGPEMWTSDGTDAGTVMVMDIWPGGMGSSDFYSRGLLSINGNLFFAANDKLHGSELWALDLTPPVSAISSPAMNEIITGSSYTITGSATDALTGVALVEVSTDSGLTWNPAVDTSENGNWSAWSNSWVIPANGSYTILTRATDKSGNIEIPQAGRTAIVNNLQTGSWVVHAVNGPVVDWDASQHGVVPPEQYLKMNGTYFYISNSGQGYPNGTTPPGYDWAYLQECDQSTGAPLFSNGDPVRASLSGIIPGTTLEAFSQWPGNTNPGAVPEMVASGNLMGAAINSLGEVVWSRFDQTSQKYQIFSSTRGQLTNDPVDHFIPAINNLGDLVWREDISSYPYGFTVRGIIAGRSVALASSEYMINKLDINDRGEVVWDQQGGSTPSRIFSSLRGQLTSDQVNSFAPSINNQGDVVFTQADPLQAGPAQVYKLAAGSATPEAVTNDAMNHGSPVINDNGEMVWLEADTSFISKVVSSIRGMLVPPAPDTFTVDLNNCGDIVYLVYENGLNKLYRLGNAAPCVSHPGANDTQEQASAVAFGDVFTGLVDPVSNPVDWYRFDAAAGDTIYITTHYDNRAPNQLAIGLYDGLGNLLIGPTATNPLSIHTTAGFSDTHFLKVVGQAGRFGYSVSISKKAATRADPYTEVFATAGPIYGTSINSLGEVVWSQNGQIFSSLRGQLTTDSTFHTSPAINNHGDMVWLESTGTNYTVKGTVAGQPVTLATSTSWIDKVDINDLGEVVWSQDSSGVNQIFSNIRGQLTDGPLPHMAAGINNHGDVVFLHNPLEPFPPFQVYKLAAGSTTPSAVTDGTWSRQSPVISDGGEIIWLEWDMNATTNNTRLVSSVRGTLPPLQWSPNYSDVDMNNCGDIVYITADYGYRIGHGEPCMTAPERLFALAVNKNQASTGTGRVVSTPAGIDLSSTATTTIAAFPVTTNVTLTATPDATSVFTGWGGACSGASGTTCTVTMDGAKGVTASFAPKITAVTLTPDVTGTIQQAGTKITFIAAASGGAGSYEYQFKLKSGTVMTEMKGYAAPGDTWEWDTSDLSPGSYTVYVYARNARSVAAYEASKGLIYTIATDAPVTSLTLTGDARSPFAKGTPANFVAQATGGLDPRYKFMVKSGTTVVTETAYAATGSWTWDTADLSPGTYSVYVYARSATSVAPFEVCKALTFTIVADAPVTTLTLTGDAKSPFAKGTPVNFIAQATDGVNPRYKYTVKSGSTIVTETVYAATGTWTWNTATLEPGTYSVYVYARSATSVAPFEVCKALTFTIVTDAPVTSVTLTGDAKSPFAKGTPVNFIAQATDGVNPRYKYTVKSGTTVVTETAYAATGSWTWNTENLSPGTYSVYVYVRSATSIAQFEASKVLTFTIVADAPVTSVTLTGDAKSPFAKGTPVNFVAQAADGVNPRYKYTVRSGSTIVTETTYAEAGSWTWNTADLSPGTYSVSVYARSATSIAPYEAVRGIGYTIN